jgi:hypothetical protein
MYRCVDGPRRGCSPTPSPGLRRGPLSPQITRSWDFYAETADSGGGLINPPGTRWLDDRNTPRRQRVCLDWTDDSDGHSSVGISGIMWTNRLRETLVRMTFGIFMGSLVLLLIILYSGVPIV